MGSVIICVQAASIGATGAAASLRFGPRTLRSTMGSSPAKGSAWARRPGMRWLCKEEKSRKVFTLEEP